MVVPHNPEPRFEHSGGLCSSLWLVDLWSELKAGDNEVMRGSDEGILLLPHNVLELVRMSSRRYQDVKLAITVTIASEVMVSGMAKGEKGKVVSLHKFLKCSRPGGMVGVGVGISMDVDRNSRVRAENIFNHH